MTLEQTITLLEAGYTKEEILALDAPQEPTPAPDPEPAPAPADPEPAPAPAGPEPQNQGQNDALQDVLKELAAVKVTLKGLQANNIRSAEGGKETVRLTADQVITDFFGQPVK